MWTIFGLFWPPSPFVDSFTKYALLVKWTFYEPPSPMAVHMVCVCPLKYSIRTQTSCVTEWLKDNLPCEQVLGSNPAWSIIWNIFLLFEHCVIVILIFKNASAVDYPQSTAESVFAGVREITSLIVFGLSS